MNRIEVLTLFPGPVQALFDCSILRRAQAKGVVELDSIDLRNFGLTKHRNVDDTPFGGGPGMLMRADVLNAALEDAAKRAGGREQLKVLFPSPRGIEIKQELCRCFAQWLLGEDPEVALAKSGQTLSNAKTQMARTLLFVCGRYEGVDERWIEAWVDFEFSLGDFVVTGGELPSLAFADAVVRLLPGVLGDERSSELESFSHGLLEYPQYTKPRVALGREVPALLLEGHHQKMEDWKLRASLMCTFAFRPDLIRGHTGEGLPTWAQDLVGTLKRRLEDRSQA